MLAFKRPGCQRATNGASAEKEREVLNHGKGMIDHHRLLTVTCNFETSFSSAFLHTLGHETTDG